MDKKIHIYFPYVAYGAGISALAYAYSFIILKNPFWYSIALMLLGVFSLKVMVILYGRLKGIQEDVARYATIAGMIGAVGVILHGGYDLANVINPPSGLATLTDLPSQIDPRGLLAFGFTGVALIKISWLMMQERKYPQGLVWTGILSGVLLIIIYVARLTVLSPTNPWLLYPVLLNGFVVNPVWFLWLGVVLRKKS